MLPLRDIVIYPFMIVPLFVSRDKSISAVDEALDENRMILLVSQKDLNKEEPQQEDLYEVGTVAMIMRMLKLPDGRIRILIQGFSRAEVEFCRYAGSDYVQVRSRRSRNRSRLKTRSKSKRSCATSAVRWSKPHRSARTSRRK